MTQTIEPEVIRAEIEQAFLPHRTVAEVWDYGQKLKFQVHAASDDRPIYECPELLVRLCNKRPELDNVLRQFREVIEAKAGSNDA